MTTITKPARKPLDATVIKVTTDRVRCYLTNATIDLPEYSDPDFRVMQIDQALQLLMQLKATLAVDSALQKLRR